MKTTKLKVVQVAALMLLAGGANAQSSLTLGSPQSNVTLFGVIDVNATSSSPGAKVGGDNLIVMNDGSVNGLNGTRWGLRLQKDLGGDIKAGAMLESGFNIDNGTSGQGGRLFGRQAYISIASLGIGELRAGRQTILSDALLAQAAPFGANTVTNSGIGFTNMGKNIPLWIDAPRADNVVQYQTPVAGGLTAAVQYAPGENLTDTFQGVRVQYAKAPFNAGVTYESNTARVGGDATNKILSLVANYDFGTFKLMGGVQQSRDLTTTSGNGAAVSVSNLVVAGPTTFTMKDARVFTVGAEVPIGALNLLGLNYTTSTYESATGASSNVGRLALTVRRNLMENTFVYGGLSVATGDLQDYVSQKNVVQIGLRTSF
jgi:predicted porin